MITQEKSMPAWWDSMSAKERKEILQAVFLPTNFARFRFRELPELVIDRLEPQHKKQTDNAGTPISN